MSLNQVRRIEKNVNKRFRVLERKINKNKNKGSRKPSGFALPTKISNKVCGRNILIWHLENLSREHLKQSPLISCRFVAFILIYLHSTFKVKVLVLVLVHSNFQTFIHSCPVHSTYMHSTVHSWYSSTSAQHSSTVATVVHSSSCTVQLTVKVQVVLVHNSTVLQLVQNKF